MVVRRNGTGEGCVPSILRLRIDVKRFLGRKRGFFGHEESDGPPRGRGVVHMGAVVGEDEDGRFIVFLGLNRENTDGGGEERELHRGDGGAGC